MLVIGQSAGESAAGRENVMLGYQAGQNIVGNGNVFIGDLAGKCHLVVLHIVTLTLV